MKKLIVESDIINLIRSGLKILHLKDDDIITTLALDKIKSSGISVLKNSETSSPKSEDSSLQGNILGKKVAIGSDHTGFDLKGIVTDFLTVKSYDVLDLGTYNKDSCDYPDFAHSVALKVASKEVDFGIIIDATGIPSAITANKIPGIRAATCYNEFSARSAREHNNANILVLGSRTFGEETVKSILNVWLSGKFSGGRHQRRLDKISSIEDKYSKK